MKPVRLVPVGEVDRHLLEAARRALVIELRAPCRDALRPLDPEFAFRPERGQYHATVMVEKLAELGSKSELTVGVSAVDIFMPVLTFVFGEAQLGGYAAIVSYHRLRQSFYGLPDDDALTARRLGKEVVHEAGHILGLTHCDDYECVMASSHAVEWLDIKSSAFCEYCRVFQHS
ncbi:MAG TPA: archaemetzincin family Zn-dependent metalloprotease [Thermoanaerobaculia bacterium]|nr:archaemetzincin family Zn-dependent metalloprotease [Thermoanaerobaculia bacterium]